LDLSSRGPSIKTRVGEAERKDKPASLAVHLDQAQGALAPSLQNLEDQEDQEDQEEEIRSWMGTRGSSFRQEEVALAMGEGRGKHLLRLTSTTDSLVWATCSTLEEIFPTVEAVVMATITTEVSTTTEVSIITTADSTTTMGDSTTTMEDSATVVRVKAMDVSVSTASHSVTDMGMSMELARGGIAVAEHGATQQDGTTGDVGT